MITRRQAFFTPRIPYRHVKLCPAGGYDVLSGLEEFLKVRKLLMRFSHIEAYSSLGRFGFSGGGPEPAP